MKLNHFPLAILLSILVAFPGWSQVSFFEILSPDSITHARIETDLRQLIRKKMDMEYQEGEFTFLNGPMKGEHYEVGVRARGNIRKEVCYYPPIKLKFPKAEIEDNKIKWVNICDGTKVKSSLLFREYIVYKLYQLLTDHSFDVRMFFVEFFEPDEAEPKFTSYSFMIEPMDHLEKRTSSEEYEPKIMRGRILDRYYYPLVEVFQYLIANTDWHVANAHNLKFLKSFERRTVIPVPYDFDYSGFVDANYAVPRDELPIENVRERYNKGHCMTEEELEEVWALVSSKKEEMLDIIRNFDLLEERERENLLKYFEDGFEDLEKEKVRRRIFTRDCDGLD